MRYEEHTELDRGIPFSLGEGIVRTPRLFSDRQNWHSNIELQLATDGEGTVLIDGEKHLLRAGEVALIPSDAIHYTYSDTSLTYTCLIVGEELCRRMELPYRGTTLRSVVSDPELRGLLLSLCEVYSGEDALRTARLNRLLLDILLLIFARYASPAERVLPDEREMAAVKRALLYIREHFAERVTLAEVARASLRDKYSLCKSFKKYTGQTVFESLAHYRCIRAAEWLAEGYTVAEVAERVGFSGVSFFTRTFKRYMGKLPSQVREKGKAKIKKNGR